MVVFNRKFLNSMFQHTKSHSLITVMGHEVDPWKYWCERLSRFFSKEITMLWKMGKERPFYNSECYRKHSPTSCIEICAYSRVKAFFNIFFNRTHVKWSLPSPKVLLSGTMVSEAQISQISTQRNKHIKGRVRCVGSWPMAALEKVFLISVLL